VRKEPGNEVGKDAVFYGNILKTKGVVIIYGEGGLVNGGGGSKKF
jgi:hypothetical protein